MHEKTQKSLPIRVFRIDFYGSRLEIRRSIKIERFLHFSAKQKVLKFQHFKDSTKFLHFHVSMSEHPFFRNFRPPYTKLPLKKSLFRAFIHLNTPPGYFSPSQGHARPLKAKRAMPPALSYRQHIIGRPRRPPLQQRLAQSIVPQSCPQ